MTGRARNRFRAVGSLRGNSATRWLFAERGLAGTPWEVLSRTGQGAYVDAAGLIQTTTAPRITHDPVTLQRLGLLVEGQAATHAPRDTALDSWTQVGATVATNSATAPDGAATADKIIERTGDGVSYIQITTTGSGGPLMLFVKPAGRRFVFFESDLASSRTFWDTQTNTYSQIGAGVTAVQAVQYKNGWWLIGSNGAHTGNLYVGLAAASGSISYTGDGESGAHVWGVNVGNPGSYIPNPGTGSAVRVTDDWHLTGTDFSSAIDPAVGTIVVEFYWTPGPSVGGVFSISDNTAANRIEYRAGQGYFEVNAGGVNRAGVSGLTPVVGLNRIAVAWSAAGYAVSLNGAPPSSGTANCGGLIATQLQLGNIAPRNNADFALRNVIRGARSLRGQYITGAALQALTV